MGSEGKKYHTVLVFGTLGEERQVCGPFGLEMAALHTAAAFTP